MRSIFWVSSIATTTAQKCSDFVDDYVYQSITPEVASSEVSGPYEDKYTALLNKTCAAALAEVPVLPSDAAIDFMNAYTNYTGYNCEK